MKVKAAKSISALVIVAVLAVVMLLSLSGVNRKSAVAACNAEASTVEAAVAAFQTLNPNLPVTPKSLMSATHGGPFLKSWPDNRAHYVISLRAAGVVVVSTPSKPAAAPYGTAHPCSSAK